MKGCVSQKNSYIVTDKLHADLDKIQKGCGGRWGEGRGVKKKKNHKRKKYGIIRSQSTLTCWGMPFPLHFKPLLLRFSTIATSSLPVCAGYPCPSWLLLGRRLPPMRDSVSLRDVLHCAGWLIPEVFCTLQPQPGHYSFAISSWLGREHRPKILVSPPRL